MGAFPAIAPESQPVAGRSFGGVRHLRMDGTSSLAKARAEEAPKGLQAALNFPIRD